MSGRLSAVALTLSLALSSAGAAQDPILSSARQLRESGEVEASLTLLQQKLERDGSSPALMAELGLTEVAMDRWTEAARHLRIALDADQHPFIRRHRAELDRALTKAQRETGSPEPTPAAPESAPSADNPFAADAEAGAAPALPMTESESESESESGEPSPPPGSEAIPTSLRRTLGGEGPAAAPLTRTDWRRAQQGLPFFGISVAGSYSWGKPFLEGDFERRGQSPASQGGVRVGLEVNLPLLPRLFGAVRVFGGFTMRPSEEYRLIVSESLSDPNFEQAITYGSSYRDSPMLPMFGVELLGRVPFGPLIVGAGVRAAGAVLSGDFGSSQTFVFARGDTCDFSRQALDTTPDVFQLTEHYGCDMLPTPLPASESQRFQDYRVWFIDFQALIEVDWSPTERFALRLTLGLGRPAVSVNLGFVVGLGPVMGGER